VLTLRNVVLPSIERTYSSQNPRAVARTSMGYWRSQNVPPLHFPFCWLSRTESVPRPILLCSVALVLELQNLQFWLPRASSCGLDEGLYVDVLLIHCFSLKLPGWAAFGAWRSPPCVGLTAGVTGATLSNSFLLSSWSLFAS